MRYLHPFWITRLPHDLRRVNALLILCAVFAESNNSLRNRLNTFIPYDSESDSDSSKTVTE